MMKDITMATTTELSDLEMKQQQDSMKRKLQEFNANQESKQQRLLTYKKQKADQHTIEQVIYDPNSTSSVKWLESLEFEDLLTLERLIDVKDCMHSPVRVKGDIITSIKTRAKAADKSLPQIRMHFNTLYGNVHKQRALAREYEGSLLDLWYRYGYIRTFSIS